MLLRVLPGPLLDERIENVRVSTAFKHIVEELDLRPFRIAHRSAEPMPLRRLQSDHPNVAIRARQDRCGSGQAHAPPGALLVSTILGEGTNILGTDEECCHDLGAGDIEMLSPADPLPPE